jgi:VWFA-related protein
MVQAQGNRGSLQINVSLVTVDLRVLGPLEDPVATLVKDDFLVYEDGQTREIRSFAPVETPNSVLLLIDRSVSMEAYLDVLESSASRFLSVLRTQDRVSIAAFDEKVERVLEWTVAGSRPPVIVIRPTLQVRYPMEVEPISGQLLPPVPGAGKDFYAALAWAVRDSNAVGKRKGVIVLSDGAQDRAPWRVKSVEEAGRSTVTLIDAENDRDFQKILSTLSRSETPFYFVAINSDLNPTPDLPVYGSIGIHARLQVRSRLEQLAEASGGGIIFPKRPEDAIRFYERIVRELGTSYTLGFTPSQNARDGKYHKIEVRVRNGALRVTQSRNGYYDR